MEVSKPNTKTLLTDLLTLPFEISYNSLIENQIKNRVKHSFYAVLKKIVSLKVIPLGEL